MGPRTELLRARRNFVEMHSLTSESVNFVPRLPCSLSDKSLIDKALANPYVHTRWEIVANRLHRATLRDHKQGSLAGGHYKRRRTGWSFRKFAGGQRNCHGQVVFHAAAWTNVDLATISPLLAQIAKLPQELWVLEQFDLALDQQKLQVGKDLLSCLRPESTNLVPYSELKQVLAYDVAAELVTDSGIYAVVIEDGLNLSEHCPERKRRRFRSRPTSHAIFDNLPIG